MKLLKTILKKRNPSNMKAVTSHLKCIYPFLLVFMTSNSRAREIGESLNTLNTNTQSKIVLPLSVFGFIVAGLYYVFGKQEASQRFSQVLMGVCVALGGTAIVSFIKGAM